MTTHHFLSQFSNVPIYNTKAVVLETGIPADTFRAWERRYGIPQPQRTDGGHRLYSERDIAIIRWLRDRTAEGLNISQAIALMSKRCETSLAWEEQLPNAEPHSWHNLIRRLLAALSNFDEKQAEQTLGEAFAIYPLDDILEKLIAPLAAEIGTCSHHGRIPVTAERFALHFIRRKLFSILNTFVTGEGRGLVLIGCAPSEPNDIGALLLSVVLVRHGWQVVYLGGEVPPDDLLETIQRLHPDMVCLSAFSPQTAAELLAVGRAIASLPPPVPHFAYTGEAFHHNPMIRKTMPGIFLEDSHHAIDALASIAP